MQDNNKRLNGPLKHFPTMKEDDPDPRNGPVRIYRKDGRPFLAAPKAIAIPLKEHIWKHSEESR